MLILTLICFALLYKSYGKIILLQSEINDLRNSVEKYQEYQNIRNNRISENNDRIKYIKDLHVNDLEKSIDIQSLLDDIQEITK